MKKEDILVVVAIPVESDGLIEETGVPLLYAGVGKIMAATTLAEELSRSRPAFVINYGTAGTKSV